MHEKFLEDISFNEDRYKVTLPRKNSHTELPDNYSLSLRRLGVKTEAQATTRNPKSV